MNRPQGVVPISRDYFARKKAHLRGAEKITRKNYGLQPNSVVFLGSHLNITCTPARGNVRRSQSSSFPPDHEILILYLSSHDRSCNA